MGLELAAAPCPSHPVPLPPSILLAVPNVSEGRDARAIAAIAAAFTVGPQVRVVDRHADPDHHRSVFSLAGPQGSLGPALRSGAAEALRRIDLTAPRGVHPYVGAVDLVALVHLQAPGRGAACAEALVTAGLLGDDLGVPILLYGALAGGRARADLRRGGVAELARRLQAGELRSDFGPNRIDPRVGATLVGARPPLVAFNLELAGTVSLDNARRIAASVREGGQEGLPGLRAIGVVLASRAGLAQISMNVENPLAVPLAAVVEAVGRQAELAGAEIVGLVPEAALAGFPDGLPIRNFDADRQVIERVVGRLGAGAATD